MLAPFESAGKLLGTDCPLRTTIIAGASDLPDGEYVFLDTYCTDNKCDCRKTIIQVFHEDLLVSILSFGWESPKFYLRWLHNTQDREFAKEMSGLSIDHSSPNRVAPEAMLSLVDHLMDETWISVLKGNYKQIRKTIRPDNIIRMVPKISRNSPCSCGSGKKHKNCCL
ncbi:MAG: SEC-C domain-containing protein [Verrucomicrobiales bacterium]|nr:SEC-C domain-containing protein [Verrucomicrobiales bacterium]